MAENREEVLSQLYALRGSISYMSRRTQPVLEREKLISEVVTRKDSEYFYHKNNAFDPETQETNIKYHERRLQEELKKHKKSKTIALICVAAILIGVFLMVLFAAILDGMAGFAAIGGALAWLGVMGLIFLPAKFSRSREISSVKKDIEEAKSLKDIYIEENKLIQAEKAELDSAKATLQNVKDEKAELADELRPIYDATIATYSDMIDERDWEYLDVVIYYFETKRADSIKEALQLVDRMVQTNMIISAVETASKDIQNCIYNACRVLAGTITAACNKICAGLGAVVSAVDMQNALYEQSNRTSSQMAADIKYIKEKTDKISKNRN